MLISYDYMILYLACCVVAEVLDQARVGVGSGSGLGFGLGQYAAARLQDGGEEEPPNARHASATAAGERAVAKVVTRLDCKSLPLLASNGAERRPSEPHTL